MFISNILCTCTFILTHFCCLECGQFRHNIDNSNTIVHYLDFTRPYHMKFLCDMKIEWMLCSDRLKLISCCVYRHVYINIFLLFLNVVIFVTKWIILTIGARTSQNRTTWNSCVMVELMLCLDRIELISCCVYRHVNINTSLLSLDMVIFATGWVVPYHWDLDFLTTCRRRFLCGT